MLGYITPDKPELKVREYELYSAYYCGICKAIKRRHGEIPRLVLSYDSVLLAMVLSSVLQPELWEEEELSYHGPPALKQERCMVHPIKKKNIVYNDSGVDYAADMLVELAYHKFRDDWKDEKKLIGALGMVAFKGVHRNITGMYPETCDIIMKSIQMLAELEKKNSQSMDEAAEPFAQLMKGVFSGFPSLQNPEQRKALEDLGYNLGKWVYLIDAVDDLEQDIDKKRYNPLKSMKDDEGFQKRMEFSLFCALENASLALKRLELIRNKEILENIIYFGLFKRTEGILGVEEDQQNTTQDIDKERYWKNESI